MTTGISTSAIRRLTAALLALLIAMPALAVIAQPASAHRQTTQRCDYDPISGQSFNCRQVPVSHTHPKPKPEPTCPTGTTGTPPNCSPIPSDNTNHAGDSDGSEESDDSDDSDSSDDADDNRGAQNGNGDSDGPFGGSQEDNPTQENINSENNQNHDSGSNQRDESTSQQNSGNGDSDGAFGGSQEQNPTEENINSENNQNHDSGSNQQGQGHPGGTDDEPDSDHGDEGTCYPPRACVEHGNDPEADSDEGGCYPPRACVEHDGGDPPGLDDAAADAATLACTWMGDAGGTRVELACGAATIVTGISLDAVEGEELDWTDISYAGISTAGCVLLTTTVAGGIVCFGVTYSIPHIANAAVSVGNAIINAVRCEDCPALPPPTGTTTPESSDQNDDDEEDSHNDGSAEQGPPTGTTTPEHHNGGDGSPQSHSDDESTVQTERPVQTPDTSTQTEPADNDDDNRQSGGGTNDANGETEPSTTTTTHPVAVGPVTGLGGSADGNSVWLGWNAPATGPTPTAYSVLRTASGGAEQEVARVGGNAYFDSDVQSGVTYIYRIQAISGTLVGPISVPTSVTIP